MKSQSTGWKRARVGLMAAALCLGVAACGSSEGAGGDEKGGLTLPSGKVVKSIAYGDIETTNSQYKALGDRIVETAENAGIKVYRFDNKQDATTALKNARLMVQVKPDVIIDFNSVTDANQAIGDLFVEAKIPCVSFNQGIPGCTLLSYDRKKLAVQEAQEITNVMKAKGWTGADTFLIMGWAPAFGIETNVLGTYFYSELAKQFPEWKQAAPEDIPLTTTKLGDHAVFVDAAAQLQQTYTVVKRALQTIPDDMNVIVDVYSDDSVLGAERALTESGRKNFVIATNGIGAGGREKMLADPNLVVGGDLFFDTYPKLGLAMALARADGVELPELPEFINNLAQPVTRDNIGTYYDESTGLLKQAPPLPASISVLEPYLEALGGLMPEQ